MIVPAEAVIQRGQVLFIRTRCKGQVGGNLRDRSKSDLCRIKTERSPGFSSWIEEYGMASGLVKWDDRGRNSRGEDDILDLKHGKKVSKQELTLNCESIGSKRD